jgi:hypothetical protein
MGVFGSLPLWAFFEHMLYGSQLRFESASLDGKDLNNPKLKVKITQSAIRFTSDRIIPLHFEQKPDLIFTLHRITDKYQKMPVIDGSVFYLKNEDGDFLFRDKNDVVIAAKPLRDKNGTIKRNKDGSPKLGVVKICSDVKKRMTGFERLKLPASTAFKAAVLSDTWIINPRLIALAIFAAAFDTAWFELGKYVGKTNEQAKSNTADSPTLAIDVPATSHLNDTSILAATALPIPLQTPSEIKHKIKSHLANAATQNFITSTTSQNSNTTPQAPQAPTALPALTA